MVFSNPDRPFCRLSAAIAGTVSNLAFQFEKEALGKLDGVRGFAPYRRRSGPRALAVFRIEIRGGGKRTARIAPGSLPASVPRFFCAAAFAWKAIPWGGAAQAPSGLGKVARRTPGEAWTLSESDRYRMVSAPRRGLQRG